MKYFILRKSNSQYYISIAIGNKVLTWKTYFVSDSCYLSFIRILNSKLTTLNKTYVMSHTKADN